MHALLRHSHRQADDEGSAGQTKGLVLNTGWGYDAAEWLFGGILFHGQLKAMRRRTAELAALKPGEAVLDVGCGTGTLALDVQPMVGQAGRVCGIDPGGPQIGQARAKAARRGLPVDFQVGVVERLPFDDGTFDAVLSTIMMHHLGDDLKRRGLAEIARVLKPGGRLVIADFKRPEEHRRPQPGSVDGAALPALVEEAGFGGLSVETRPLAHFASGIIFVRAVKG